MYSYPIDLTKLEKIDDLPRAFPLRSAKLLKHLLKVDDLESIESLASKAGRYYRPFDRKKEGKQKWRHIDNPNGDLKEIQRRINKRILSRIQLPPTMVGGVKRRSIKDNAQMHLNRNIIVTLDLKNCFPSIRPNIVYSIFKDGLKLSSEHASAFTRLTTFQQRLPQGAPTSLTLANLALLPLHNEISSYCEANSITFSFFVDDIAISGGHPENSISDIVKIIQTHGYAISNKKLKIMPKSTRQSITGVVVNKKLSISKEQIDRIRNNIIELGQKPENITRQELQIIYGKINHVCNICPLRGGQLLKLAKELLPATGKNMKIFKKDETRPCHNTHTHRAYTKKRG